MAAKMTRQGHSTKAQQRRLNGTVLDTSSSLEQTKDSSKVRKSHSSTPRVAKARASMACERCKHKKVKCEDFIEGKGCEKCRASNEPCFFHRKEVEIKTSFRQGYVENCEREVELLRDLVLRMWKQRDGGWPQDKVDVSSKDGNPNITSLMHNFGVGIGEDFLGSYEAREAKLAAEGQPLLTSNGKGDIQLPDGTELQTPLSPDSAIDSIYSSDRPADTRLRGSIDSSATRSRSPSIGLTSSNSRTVSRKSSDASLSEYSPDSQRSPAKEAVVTEVQSLSPYSMAIPYSNQQLQVSPITPLTPPQEQYVQALRYQNMQSSKPQFPPDAMFLRAYANQSDSFQQARPLGMQNDFANMELDTYTGIMPDVAASNLVPSDIFLPTACPDMSSPRDRQFAADADSWLHDEFMDSGSMYGLSHF